MDNCAVMAERDAFDIAGKTGIAGWASQVSAGNNFGEHCSAGKACCPNIDALRG